MNSETGFKVGDHVVLVETGYKGNQGDIGIVVDIGANDNKHVCKIRMITGNYVDDKSWLNSSRFKHYEKPSRKRRINF